MTLKGDAKFKGKLTRGLKSDIKNLINFHLNGLILSKAYKLLDEKVQTLSHDTEE